MSFNTIKEKFRVWFDYKNLTFAAALIILTLSIFTFSGTSSLAFISVFILSSLFILRSVGDDKVDVKFIFLLFLVILLNIGSTAMNPVHMDVQVNITSDDSVPNPFEQDDSTVNSQN